MITLDTAERVILAYDNVDQKLREQLVDEFGDISGMVKSRREKLDLSCRALARKVGVSDVFLRKCEKGHKLWPLRLLVRVLRTLEKEEAA